MQFKTPNGEPFEIPTELWEGAGMFHFVGSRCCYHVHDVRCTLIPASDIEPLQRKPGLEGFGENGLNDGRLDALLKEFRNDAPVHPIELIELKPGDRYGYRIHHGVHRFYASVAAGFSHLPAQIIDDSDLFLDNERKHGAERVTLRSGAPESRCRIRPLGQGLMI